MAKNKQKSTNSSKNSFFSNCGKGVKPQTTSKQVINNNRKKV